MKTVLEEEKKFIMTWATLLNLVSSCIGIFSFLLLLFLEWPRIIQRIKDKNNSIAVAICLCSFLISIYGMVISGSTVVSINRVINEATFEEYRLIKARFGLSLLLLGLGTMFLLIPFLSEKKITEHKPIFFLFGFFVFSGFFFFYESGYLIIEFFNNVPINNFSGLVPWLTPDKPFFF